METVPYSSVVECSVKQRHIFVITVCSSEKKLIFNKQYCHFLPPKEIIYNLNYLNVSEKTTLKTIQSFARNFHTELNDVCNALLIYFDPSIKKLNELFLDILTFFQVYTLKKTVYINLNIKNSDIVIDSDVVEEKYGAFFSSFNFALIGEIEDFAYTEKLESGLKVIFYDGGSIKSEDLSCQPWFRKFLSRVFSCGAKRLIQIEGTCYINSVINSIILSPVLLNFFLQKIKDFVVLFPDAKQFISTELNASDMTSCRYFGNLTDEIQFFYRIIYNLVCKNARPFPRIKLSKREDFFIQASKDYFSSSSTGHGGRIIPIIFSLFQESNSKFQIAIQSDVDKKLIFFNYEDVYTFEKTKKIYSQLLELNKSKLIGQKKPAENTEIIIFFPKKTEILMESEALQLLHHLLFNPQAGTFMLKNEDKNEENKINYHAITAFFCDGIPKVYDSAYNSIYELNWLGDRKDFIESWNMFSRLQIFDADCKYVIFTKSTLPDKINRESCFEMERGAKRLRSSLAENRELSWAVPLRKLIRDDGFSTYFLELVKRKVPGIGKDFFDTTGPFADVLYKPEWKEKNDQIILDVIQAYPSVDFNSYPLIALKVKPRIPIKKLIVQHED